MRRTLLLMVPALLMLAIAVPTQASEPEPTARGLNAAPAQGLVKAASYSPELKTLRTNARRWALRFHNREKAAGRRTYKYGARDCVESQGVAQCLGWIIVPYSGGKVLIRQRAFFDYGSGPGFIDVDPFGPCNRPPRLPLRGSLSSERELRAAGCKTG